MQSIVFYGALYVYVRQVKPTPQERARCVAMCANISNVFN